MNLTFDAKNLPLEEQHRLYLWLKANFEPDSSVVFTGADFRREDALSKATEELKLTNRVCSRLLGFCINTVRELCSYKSSDIV